MTDQISQRVVNIIFGVGLVLGSAFVLSPFGFNLYSDPVVLIPLGCLILAGSLLIASGLRETVTVGSLTLDRYSSIGVADVLIGLAVIAASVQLLLTPPDQSGLMIGTIGVLAGAIGVAFGIVQYRVKKPLREMWAK